MDRQGEGICKVTQIPLAVTPMGRDKVKMDPYPPRWTLSLAGSIEHADFALCRDRVEMFSVPADRNAASDPGQSK